MACVVWRTVGGGFTGKVGQLPGGKETSIGVKWTTSHS